MTSRPPAPSAARRPQGEQVPAADDSSQSGKNTSASAGAAAAAGAAAVVNPMVGRKILKPLGDKHCQGYVAAHKPAPAGGGGEELWVLRWDDDGVEDEEVTRSVLDKRINLHSVKEREFPPPTPEKTRQSPRKAVPSPKRAVGRPRKVPTPSSSKAGAKKRSAASGGASPASGGSSGTPKKKAKKVDSSVLLSTKEDVGKLVAKQFNEGVFTGEAVDVKEGPKPLWSIRYEDGDSEDLGKEEMQACMKLYETLAAKYASVKGRDAVDSDKVDESDDSDKEPASAKGKGKGKGKGGQSSTDGKESAQDVRLGSRVRKFFRPYKDGFDGTVSKFFPEESGDKFGDLWLIKYDDGDSEHMNLQEVRKAQALFDDTYALQRREVTLPKKLLAGEEKGAGVSGDTKVILFAEKPAGSRLFSAIKTYRAHKKAAS